VCISSRLFSDRASRVPLLCTHSVSSTAEPSAVAAVAVLGALPQCLRTHLKQSAHAESQGTIRLCRRWEFCRLQETYAHSCSQRPSVQESNGPSSPRCGRAAALPICTACSKLQNTWSLCSIGESSWLQQRSSCTSIAATVSTSAVDAAAALYLQKQYR
jgi:hypothetical protein